ncbi:hypothetical protein [Hespellia stercorisuis]|uniref:Uncharacterized protein n=1 Tax=Hespellia stercorisuis DSM 15480 TaxID=1121950 RepID=A0A1M6J1Q9_9FIRM|nr:hypothetical protein [Hespellia stercorisuis]SHJ40582.1 hypothetical protein SAMN02745243_00508 [Hespellia stercorisuis DSM 15480]
MKQLIAYIYEYNGSQKVHNVGFLKIQFPFQSYLVQMHMKPLPFSDGSPLKLHIFYKDGSDTVVQFLTELSVKNHNLNVQLAIPAEQLSLKNRLQECDGFLLLGPNHSFYAATWVNVAVDPDRLRDFSLDSPKSRDDLPSDSAQTASTQTASTQTASAQADDVSVEAAADVSAAETGDSADVSQSEADSGTTDSESGTADTDFGSVDTDSGTTVSGSGTADIDSGTTVSGSGTADIDSGTTVSGSGTADSGTADSVFGDVNSASKSIPVDAVSESNAADSDSGTTVSESNTADASDASCIPAASREEDSGRLHKIQRSELSVLPRRSWNVANNSFLLHGLHNYHHLLLVTEDETYILGVPGIYDRREAHAAEFFGFPIFEKKYLNALDLSSDERSDHDNFGYWCKRIPK